MRFFNIYVKSFIRLILVLCTYLFDTIIISYLRGGNLNDKKHVLLIRLDSIGDFILWLDAAKEYKMLYPEEKIILVANNDFASLASLLPYWDEVIPVDRNKYMRNPIYRYKISILISKQRVHTAIQPTFSRQFRQGDSIIRFSGACHRIGFDGDLSNMTSLQKKVSNRWYSQLVTATNEPLMEIQRNAEFIKGLGLQNFSASRPYLPKTYDLSSDLTINKSYFIIFPGAFHNFRMWPAEKFAEVLSRLVESNYGLAVLCGGLEERDLCSQIIHLSGKEALNLAGETSLPELVEVIRRSKFLIGNETSAIHIAAAVATPSVCILGGGHYGRFVPYILEEELSFVPVPVTHFMDCFKCNWQCKIPHEKDTTVPCILHISVDDVLTALYQALSVFNIPDKHTLQPLTIAEKSQL